MLGIVDVDIHLIKLQLQELLAHLLANEDIDCSLSVRVPDVVEIVFARTLTSPERLLRPVLVYSPLRALVPAYCRLIMSPLLARTHWN